MGIFAKQKKDPFARGCMGQVGEILRSRCEGSRCLMICGEEARLTHAKALLEVLTTAGFETELALYADRDRLAEQVAEASPEILFAFGEGETWRGAEEVVREMPHIHFAVMPATFRGALTIPPRGARIPDSFFCDADLFTEEKEETYREGIIYAIRLGLAFDRWVFDAMYSSFDPSPVVRRSVGIWHDLIKAEEVGSEARKYLSCGGYLAKVAKRLDESLTDAEALGIGLLWESKIARAVGVAREKYYDDLLGMLSFWGFPLGIEVSREELTEAVQGVAAPQDEVTLYLAKKRGHCVPYSISYEKLIALLG